LNNEPNGAARSVQFGSTRLDFAVGDAKGFVVLPSKAEGRDTIPWVWHAPTLIGSLPSDTHDWMYRQLLDNGFAIGGVDVGESYGNPAGRAVYSQYHELVVERYGLSRKACLMPQSRGGLMLYNWAADHPDCVQCIGGIYTVCDLESWPGLEKPCAAYGMTEDEFREALPRNNPIERLDGLARERAPILHVHGDSDDVVPLERNSGALIRRYVDLGGPGRLLIIEGKGHEECREFFQCEELVAFLLAEGYPDGRESSRRQD